MRQAYVMINSEVGADGVVLCLAFYDGHKKNPAI